MNDTPTSHHAEHIAATNDDGDDGLGYYSDGAKRTLTDQQIAMFRHSEVYGIVRAREVGRENEEFDEEEGGAEEIEEASSSKDKTRAKEEEEEEEEVEEIRVSKGTGRVGEGSSQNKRRKMNRQRNTQASGQDIPSRRVIREMDAAVEGEGCELDY